jgi:hypothetical protein
VLIGVDQRTNQEDLIVQPSVISAMSDENQHWVPKFLIKYFADKDGRVFCLR